MKAEEKEVQLRLSDSEYRFMNIVWETAPINSTQLARLCLERLGWKKSTTYTVIKKLEEKQILSNTNALVCYQVEKESVVQEESEALLQKSFGGSVPDFLAAFLKDRKLTEQEVARIQEMIREAAR